MLLTRQDRHDKQRKIRAILLVTVILVPISRKRSVQAWTRLGALTYTSCLLVFQAMRAMNEPFESREDAKAEMARMDKDGSMTIDFPEFVNFITPRLLESGSARYDVEEQYLKFCDLCLTHHEILTDGKCPLDEGGNKSECNKGDPDIE